MSINMFVSADDAHLSFLTFIMCTVHRREEQAANENNKGSNAEYHCQNVGVRAGKHAHVHAF